MMRNTFVFLLVGFLFLSCESQNKTTNKGPQPTKDPTVYKGVTDLNCAVEVNFGSEASGIDGNALEKVTALIGKYNLDHTSKPLGMEGERRICLPLKELKSAKKKEVINALKKIAKQGRMVSVSVR